MKDNLCKVLAFLALCTLGCFVTSAADKNAAKSNITASEYKYYSSNTTARLACQKLDRIKLDIREVQKDLYKIMEQNKRQEEKLDQIINLLKEKTNE